MEIRQSPRKVLLAVREEHLDARLLAAARSLCQRMEADLDMLVRVRGDVLPRAIENFIVTLRMDGVAHTLRLNPQLRRHDVVQHANLHASIATVVIDSLEGWETVSEDRASDPWAKLSCPLVTAVASKIPQKT